MKGNMVVTLDREATDCLPKEMLKERTGARQVSRRKISEMEKQGQRPRASKGQNDWKNVGVKQEQEGQLKTLARLDSQCNAVIRRC